MNWNCLDRADVQQRYVHSEGRQQQIQLLIEGYQLVGRPAVCL